MSTVRLNMIVRDEAPVIERCLRSVLPVLDAWTIVDTGSTDGTQDIVRRVLAGLPGELHERPWVDFGHNRTEAIALAGRSEDYLLFIDADEELVNAGPKALPNLDADAYNLIVAFPHGLRTHQRTFLAASRLPWRYEGVLHEFLTCDRPISTSLLVGPRILARAEGARSRDPQKAGKDAELFRQALALEPQNTRYWFYYAQSCLDAVQDEEALAAYLRRAGMEGWEEEVYLAHLIAARLLEKRGEPVAVVVHRFLEAHRARPHRAEALVDLARYHRERQEWALAYLFAGAACLADPGRDILFVEPSAHLWKAMDERAVAAYWTGRYEEARSLCAKLLAGSDLPSAERPRVRGNLKLAHMALGRPLPGR